MIYNKVIPPKVRLILAMFVLIVFDCTVYAQEEVQTITIKSRGLQRVGNTFESVWLIDNQTVLVPLKRTLEFDIQHRFGIIKNGYEDFFGLYAPSNIRLGYSYVPINRLQVGFGFTKANLLWDFSAKYAILSQDGKNGKAVSLTYLVNMAVETRDKEHYLNSSDRYSFFHQVMVARKIRNNLSVQAAVGLSHFNKVEGFVNSDNKIEGTMNNDHLTASLLGRYKLSDAFSIIANYDQPITEHFTNNPSPNISFGAEIATPLHAFQVFVGNYQWIVPQYSNVFNQYDYSKGEFLIGFNITRLMDLQEENLSEMMFRRKGKSKE